MTYDEIVNMALELPGTEESLSYGRPSVKREGRFMLRIKEDGESIAVKMSWETHDRLHAEWPDTCFKTPHYEGYPALLARLDLLTDSQARELVRASWEDAPKKAKTKSV